MFTLFQALLCDLKMLQDVLMLSEWSCWHTNASVSPRMENRDGGREKILGQESTPSLPPKQFGAPVRNSKAVGMTPVFLPGQAPKDTNLKAKFRNLSVQERFFNRLHTLGTERLGKPIYCPSVRDSGFHFGKSGCKSTVHSFCFLNWLWGLISSSHFLPSSVIL